MICKLSIGFSQDQTTHENHKVVPNCVEIASIKSGRSLLLCLESPKSVYYRSGNLIFKSVFRKVETKKASQRPGSRSRCGSGSGSGSKNKDTLKETFSSIVFENTGNIVNFSMAQNEKMVFIHSKARTIEQYSIQENKLVHQYKLESFGSIKDFKINYNQRLLFV